MKGLHYLTIEVTRICNANCPHCVLPERKNDGLRIDQLYHFLNTNLQFFKKGVTITGGEPYLTDKTHKLIHYIQKRGYKVAVISNGSLGRKMFTSAIPDALKISLDYPTNQHDTFRGIPNLFNIVTTETIPSAVSRKIPTEIMCTISRNNLQHMDGMLSLSERLGVKISFNRYIQTKAEDALALTSLEFETMLNKVRDYRKSGHDVGYTGGLGCHIEQRASFCTAGINKIHVTADGKITPCMFYLKSFGTVNRSLIKVRNAMLDWRVSYEKEVKEACGNCPHYDRICGGDCLAIAKAIGKPKGQCLL